MLWDKPIWGRASRRTGTARACDFRQSLSLILRGISELQLHFTICPTSRQGNWAFIPTVHHWPQATHREEILRHMPLFACTCEGAPIAQRQASQQSYRCWLFEAKHMEDGRGVGHRNGKRRKWASAENLQNPLEVGVSFITILYMKQLSFRRAKVAQLW